MQGMGTERHIARRLGDIDALARLEPLAVHVDQRHQGHRHREQHTGQPGNAVEGFLGRGIENVQALEETQAGCLVERRRGDLHDNALDWITTRKR